jgi:hypothetical protein
LGQLRGGTLFDLCRSLALPTKVKGVKLQGYESDSGSEAENSNQTGAAEDADDDMFDSAPKAPQVDDSDRVKDSGLDLKPSSAGKDILDINDIEGQEFGRAPEVITAGVKMVVEEGSDVEGSEDDFVSGDELANTDDAPRSRRTKRGMGYVISSFNMKGEMEEGRVQKDGSESPWSASHVHGMTRSAAFIANQADPFAAHDAWLADVSSKHDIHTALKAKQQREAQASLQDAADRSKSRVDCLKELVQSGLLRKQGNLSIMGTLAKLGQEKKQLTAANRKKHKGRSAMAVDGEAAAPARLTELTSDISRLTALASLLLDAYSEADIYDQTYEDVVKTLRLEGEVPRVRATSWQHQALILSAGMGAKHLHAERRIIRADLGRTCCYLGAIHHPSRRTAGGSCLGRPDLLLLQVAAFLWCRRVAIGPRVWAFQWRRDPAVGCAELLRRAERAQHPCQASRVS